MSTQSGLAVLQPQLVGATCLIGIGAAVVSIGVMWWKRPPYWVAMTILLGALIVLDTWLQRGGGSATSWVMLIAFLVTFGVWSVAARALNSERGRMLRVSGSMLGVTQPGVMVVLAALVVLSRDRVSLVRATTRLRPP
jgi:hypothetical protein